MPPLTAPPAARPGHAPRRPPGPTTGRPSSRTPMFASASWRPWSWRSCAPTTARAAAPGRGCAA
eukprot:7650996-Lingulodinium_polyedra.AAC.1